VSFDAAALATKSATVEMEFRYRPGGSGPTTPLALAGLCDFEVFADGLSVATGHLRTKAGDDPATAVLNPPFGSITLPLSGDSVDVMVRFRPVAGGMPDALALRVGVPHLEADAGELIARAAEAARAAEVAVVVVSTSAEVESEGFDRTSLSLPGDQDDLVRAVVAANPRTVVIVNSGAPVLLPWRDDVPTILAVWFPGQEFGHALADVLSGDAEPAGRLPVTWPATETEIPVQNVTPVDGRLPYAEGIHIGYRAWLARGFTPAYDFGHGLGYTSWELTRLAAPATVARGDTAEVSVDVLNTGVVAGKTVVQIYIERTSPSEIDRPVRWLAGFAVAATGPGGTATVTIPLSWRRFAHWAGEWSLESGDYSLQVGFSSTDLRSSVDVLVR
jgi:beta-glucosidase